MVTMKMFINIYLLMAIFLSSSCEKNTASSHISLPDSNTSVPEEKEHLTVNSTIADVLAHPAFKGFSQYVLPLEWGYDAEMPLSRIARLLPYHNYVDAERCVGYLNQMIDTVASGRKI